MTRVYNCNDDKCIISLSEDDFFKWRDENLTKKNENGKIVWYYNGNRVYFW